MACQLNDEPTIDLPRSSSDGDITTAGIGGTGITQGKIIGSVNSDGLE